MMPNVQAFLDSDSETFSYVVFDQSQGHGVIIDPVLDFDSKSGRTGTTGANRILDFVNAQQLVIDWILETHAHADHLSAAAYLKETLGSKIAIGKQITQVQAVFSDLFNFERTFLPDGSQFDRLLADNESLTVGHMRIQVIYTPGHTPADVAYLIDDALFVGDTLFMPDRGTARCDFPGGDAATLFQSTRRLMDLPDNTRLFVCHDYPGEDREHRCETTVQAQKQQNIHVKTGISEAQFVETRQRRDATLDMPRLILPSIQINIRAGEWPPAEENGTHYLKIPLNAL